MSKSSGLDQTFSAAAPFFRARRAGKAHWGETWTPVRYSTAPGRVELLGNHVDYNGGPVLAAAIDRSTAVLFDEPDQRRGSIDVLLVDAGGSNIEFHPNSVADWRNDSGIQTAGDFVRGVIAALHQRDKPLRLSWFAVASSVPIGVGVSSSAALCVALTMAFCNETLAFKELVLIAQEAEHRAGTPCGTMDQSASVAGGMIRFEGSSLAARQLNPDPGAHAFLVIDSGVNRSLVSSSYPVRVRECEQALQLFQRVLERELPNLASLTTAGLDAVWNTAFSNADEVLIRRARHVVTEVARVNAGQTALERGDWAEFGRLMTESGRSSATDYEISHPVVEELVGRLLETPGVLGARMMGGGEGGSLIALVPGISTTEVIERVTAAVNDDLEPGFQSRQVYQFAFSPGARICDVEATGFDYSSLQGI